MPLAAAGINAKRRSGQHGGDVNDDADGQSDRCKNLRGEKVMRRLKMHVLALAMSLTFAMPARAALCPPMAETAVIVSAAAMKAALEMLVTQLFDVFGLQLANFAKMKVSAVKTLTAQVATSAKAKINADVALAGGEMAALGALEHTKQSLKVYQQFSALTGQGVDPCAQLTAQTNLTLANGRPYPWLRMQFLM